MNKTNNKKLTKFSQRLRSEMTKEEKHLWYDFLKSLPQTVHRQKVIGEYIVDFYCADAKLVIEIDGWQHGTENNREYDMIRTEYLTNLGMTVVRYSNKDVNKRFKEVCLDIHNHVEQGVEKNKPSPRGSEAAFW